MLRNQLALVTTSIGNIAYISSVNPPNSNLWDGVAHWSTSGKWGGTEIKWELLNTQSLTGVNSGLSIYYHLPIVNDMGMQTHAGK